MRLDKFLVSRVDWKSRNELQTLIDEGRITVNGAVRKASTKLAVKDAVVIQLDVKEAPDYAQVPIDVIYEDDALLCLNKRAGIIVHPVGRHQLTNLLSALHARYRNVADQTKDRVPHVCHRIDRDTSGCFLVAFSNKWKAGRLAAVRVARREEGVPRDRPRHPRGDGGRDRRIDPHRRGAVARPLRR